MSISCLQPGLRRLPAAQGVYAGIRKYFASRTRSLASKFKVPLSNKHPTTWQSQATPAKQAHENLSHHVVNVVEAMPQPDVGALHAGDEWQHHQAHPQHASAQVTNPVLLCLFRSRFAL